MFGEIKMFIRLKGNEKFPPKTSLFKQSDN